MKKIVKNAFYASAGSVILSLNMVNAAINPTGNTPINTGLVGSTNTADVTIQNYISNVLGFLVIAAVVYGLWGGFNILTAAGDEEKVKKGKTVLIQVGIGLAVIFLASSIVNWLINSILTGA